MSTPIVHCRSLRSPDWRLHHALQEATPAIQAVVDYIDASRKSIKENFDTGLSESSDACFQKDPAAGAQGSAAEGKRFSAAGRCGDQAAAGSEGREPGQGFHSRCDQFGEAALRVWFSALYSTAKNDPRLARLASVKEIGWRMRDYSGPERSIIASAMRRARQFREGWRQSSDPRTGAGSGTSSRTLPPIPTPIRSSSRP